MNILITGSNGFIGKNFYRYLRENTNHKIYTFTKKDSFEKIEKIVNNVYSIFHFAGVNRTKIDSEFRDVNAKLTDKICKLLTKFRNTSLYYASSTQVKFDTSYAKSKKQGEEICLELHRKSKNDVFILRLPNIYGLGCKPNYNSVVATFCYNTANNLEHKVVDPNRVLELLHIDDLCAQLNLLTENKNNYLFINLKNTYKITVKDLSYIISNFKNVEFNSELTHTRTIFEKNLYKIYLSFLEKN